MTTYNVNILGDASGTAAGTGSGTSGDLRWCLSQASLDGVADTIVFDSAVFASQRVITLSAALTTLPSGFLNPFGQTAFIIGADDVTIDGSLGSGPGITIDGAGATRLFTVQGGGNLVVSNLTLTGGVATGGAGGNGGVGGAGGGGAGLGGAVLVNGGTSSFTANGCTFVNNVAQGGAGGTTSAGTLQAGAGGGGMGAGGFAPAGTTGGNGGGVNGGNGGPLLTSGSSGGVGGGAGGGGAGANGTSIGRPGGVGGLGGGGGGGGNFSHGGGGGFGAGGGGGGGGRGTSLGGGGGFGGGNGGLGFFNAKGGGGGGGAGLGGAIFSNGGVLTLTNSTFTQNSATGGAAGGNGTAGKGEGGAVFMRNGVLSATFVTISGNTAAQGGTGLYVLSDGAGQQAVATLTNSILGQNVSSGVTDFFATTNAGGTAANLAGSRNNLVTLNGAGSNGLPGGALVAGTNPNFSAAGLADNGGPTGTIALTPASTPALQAGASGTGVTTDQRGVTRGAPPDLGAYTSTAVIETITSSDMSVIAADASPVITFVLNVPAAAGTFTASDVSALDSGGAVAGTLGALSTADNQSFTGIFTPNAGFSGTAFISVAANRFTTQAGGLNLASPVLGIAVDLVRPSVAITSSDLSLNVGDGDPTITFTLSEAAPAGSFTAADVSVRDSGGAVVGTMGALTTSDNQTFSGVFTPNAGFTGTALISVAANQFTDAAGNGNTASAALAIAVDKVRPSVVSITSSDVSLITGDANPTITFTMSETVAGFTTADVSIKDSGGSVVGTLSALTTSDNQTFTAVFTPNAGFNGTALVSVAANAFADLAGNPNTASSALAVAVDKVSPTVVSITSSDVSLISGDANPTITFTLSEVAAAGSFTAADVSIKDSGGVVVGTMDALATSDNQTFTGVFTPNAGFNGTALVSVSANQFTDVPGNANTASSTLAVAVDKVSPTAVSITSSDVSLISGDANPTITFTLSEVAAAGSFTAADVSIKDSGGVVVGTMGALATSDNQTFTGVFTPNAGFNGTALVSVAANAFTDAPGNANTASSALSIDVDKVSPTVVSITSSDVSLINGDAGPTITFTLSEIAAAGSFTAADVGIKDSGGNVVGTMGTLATSDNKTFTGVFTANAGFNGTALVSIAANTFTDAPGNANTASSALSIAVDKVSPTVVSITSSDVSLISGDANPTITFTLSEVAAAGSFTAADVSIKDGSGNVVGTMGALSTSNNQTFTGTFTPNAGFTGTALVSIAANTFTDAPGNANTASSALSIAVDKVNPTVVSITSSDVSLISGDANPAITFTLSEVAAAGSFSAADVSIRNSSGAIVGTMGALSTSNNQTFTGTFTPNAGFNGIALISVAAGQFTDAPGNANTASSALSIAVDKASPTVVSITSSDVSLIGGDANPVITFTLSEVAAAASFTAADVSIKNGSGTVVGTMGALSTSNNQTFTGTFTPNAGFNGTALISIAANTFTDAPGNANTASSALSIAVDKVAPQVLSITSSDLSLTVGDANPAVTFTLSEAAATGSFTAADVSIKDSSGAVVGTMGALSTSNNQTFTGTFTPNAAFNGTALISVAANTFTDGPGNANTASAALGIGVDRVRPAVVSITSSDVSLINGDGNPTITFTLSEAAAAGSFTAADVSVKDGGGTVVGIMGALATSDNRTFTGTFAPNAGFNGAALISIAANAFTDAPGNGNTASSMLSIAADKVNPTVVSITSSDVTLISGDANPTITFTLSEVAAAGSFSAADVSIKDGSGNVVGTMGALSTANNRTFTGVFTPNAGFTGTALVSIAANVFTDAPGNANTASSTLAVAVDKVSPTVVSITSSDVSLISGDANPTITFTLSEVAAAGSFSAADVSIKDGSGNVVGTMGPLSTTNNQTFTGTLTPIAGFNGTALVSVAASQFTDAPGNANTASSTLSIAVDKVAPQVLTITSSDLSLILGEANPTVTFTLSEAAAAGSFTAADVSIKDSSGTVVGTMGALSTSNNQTFTGVFTPDAGFNGTALISVAANTFTDTLGNANTASSAVAIAVVAIAVDRAAPQVLSITSSDVSLISGDADPAITFTLSEAAAAGSFTAADVSIKDSGGAVVGTIGALATSDNRTFTGTFTPNAGFNGTALVSVAANVFTDTPGNANTASSALGITVDKVAPQVLSIVSSDLSLTVGDADPTLTFTLSEAAAAGSFTAADISINDASGAVVGTIGALATSDNQTFTAVFTPGAGFTGTALVSVGAGQFTDTPGNANTASPVMAIAVDQVAPMVVSITSTDTSVMLGDAWPTVTFTLSEPAVAGTFTAADVSITDGAGAIVGAMGTLATSDNRTFTGIFTPNAGYAGTAFINVAGSQFADAAGNGNTAAAALAIAVDLVSPAITSITSTDVALKNGDANPKITFTLSEAAKAGTFTAADVSIRDGSGAVAGTMGTLTTRDNMTFTGTFTPKTGFIGTALVSVDAGKFTNAAGRANLASPKLGIEVDKVAPKIVSINTSDAAVIIGDADPLITFTLSEAAAPGSFTAGDVSVKNSAGKVVGTMGALTTTDNLVFTGTLLADPAFGGTALVSVAAGQFTDAVGNGNTASPVLKVAVDRMAPTVTVTSSDYTLKAGQYSTLTIKLSGPLGPGTAFTLEDLGVTPGSGTLSHLSRATETFFFGLFERQVALTYTVRFTPAPGYEGNARITVAAGAFTDAAGNPNLVNDSTVIAVDAAVPQAPTLGIANGSDSGTTGDNVTNSKTPTITGMAEAGATVTLKDGTSLLGTAVAQADGRYAITPARALADGVHKLSVTQTDAAGNASPASAVLPLTVDMQAPVLSISTSDALLTAGQTALLTFKLNEAAAAGSFDLGDITAINGSLSDFARSATSDLLYTALFTPAANLKASGGVSVAAGSLTDAAGNGNNAAALSLAINNSVAQLVQAMASFAPPAAGAAEVSVTAPLMPQLVVPYCGV